VRPSTMPRITATIQLFIVKLCDPIRHNHGGVSSAE
jgi:hypothetical protein